MIPWRFIRRLLPGMLLAGLMLISGCPAGNARSKADRTAEPQPAAVPADPDPVAAPADPADVEAQSRPAADGAGDSGADILDRHWQETIIEFKNPITMNLELRRAEFNPAEGSDMSILQFEASCRIGRQNWLYKDLVMDSLKATDSATLELDICSVEMMPLLRNPVVSGRTSTGGTTLNMHGGLKVVVRDPRGEEMGTFLVNEEGLIDEAEPGELYSWRISETNDDMTPAEYLFYRTPGVGDSIHYEFGFAYRHGTMARQVVSDPLGHEITYVFPNGSVEIVPPNPPERRDPDEFRRN